jgi:hypothetical protein
MSVCEVLHTSQRTIFGRVLRCLEKPSAPPLAPMSKSLAETNKSPDGVKATKGYQPEGDLGEAKNKHLLAPPQGEELMELKLDENSSPR